MPAAAGACFLDEGGRSGLWIWRQGDHAAQVHSDPLQGLYVAHASLPASRGAWVRDWDGVHAQPEWFGARVDAAEIDNQPAIQAALDLCPAVLLGPGSYFMTRGVRILANGTRLIGAGITQTDQGPNRNGTELVCTSRDATIVQIGSDSPRQPAPLVECVQLRDFTVRRSVPPSVPADGIGGAIGIAMRWCVNCHVERVFSLDSARGWHFYGTVENYIVRCAALRGLPNLDSKRDLFIGFHLDYEAPLAANGGNASLYFDHCRSFGGYDGVPRSFAYSAGLRTDGGWVDLYINALETGWLQYGIDGHGNAYDGGGTYRTEDLIITNCVLDSAERAAIRLQTADTLCAVQITGCYAAALAAGTCIELRDLGGSVGLASNQFITSGPGGGGLAAVNVNNLTVTGDIHNRLARPMRLENVTSFNLQATVHALDTPNAEPAIILTRCTRGRIDCIVNGRTGAHGSGVHFVGRDNSLVEVNATNIQAGVFAQGAAGKIVHDATPVTAAGPFGSNCLATGILA